jgi:HEAT repeat protein
MSKGHKRWGAAGAAFLLAGLSVGYLRHKSRDTRRANGPSSDDDVSDPGRRWRGFAAGLTVPAGLAAEPDAGAPPPEGNGWAAPTITAQQLEAAMDAWRHGIIDKNVEDVSTLDRIFSLYPGRYGPELVKLVEHDPEERVRAFSTRVLGKLKNVELADIFQHSLADGSPFVRQNAAWALGELATRPNGRDMAEAAVAELRHLEEADPAEAVRAAAANALKRLQ